MSQHLQTAQASLTPAGRFLAIDTPLGPDAMEMTRLEGEDTLSRCFLYRVTIVTTRTDAAIESLLGLPVTLWLLNNRQEERRPLHGHVRRVTGHGRDAHGHRQFEMEVVPRLWFLSCTSDCRIFQNQTVPDIIKTVLTDQELTNFEFRVVREQYQPIEYCVQYQESALDFLSRLMEHLGLFYWHEHTAAKHTLVIGDRNAAAMQAVPPTVTIRQYDNTDSVRNLEIDSAFRPGKWTLNDYDFESPTKQLLVNTPTLLTVPRMLAHEMYEYPGNFQDRETGRLLTRLRVELEETRQRRVFGDGYCIGFDPGRRVTVAGASGTPGTSYLLTEVRHRATSPGLEADSTPGYGYANTFTAIPAANPFRPERVTPKPFMRGAQTASVVGPAGENIHCDEYGRVRVQFHWDRLGQRNHQSSCWIRVAQARAGSHYGNQVLPHVGHEVIVSFLEGDPDRPLITGTVPNALTMPPMKLPLDKDKTIQRDHGNNKIVMQGKSGGEHLSMVSPRALNLFSAGDGARAVSASDSSNFNLYGTAEDGSLGGVIGSSGLIPYYKDQTGFNSLKDNWTRVIASDLTNYNTIGTDSELNWGSTGRINCMSLGNTNNWVNADSNTWVNVNSYSEVGGNSSSEVKGNSSSIVKGDAYSRTEGGSNSLIFKYSVTTVLGDNTSTVVGTTQSFNIGMNISMNIIGNLTVNVGATYAINLDLAGDFSPLKIDTAGNRIKTDIMRLNNSITRIDQDVARIDDHVTAIDSSVTHIHQSPLRVFL